MIDTEAGLTTASPIPRPRRSNSSSAKVVTSNVPPTYVDEMEALIAALGLERFVLFGTSLGGLITMLLALKDKSRIAGALTNDIGPVLESRGLERIRAYVGRGQNWPTWLHAARFLKEAQADRYPDWRLDQWIAYAKRLCRLTPAGRVVLDYDPRIAEPFREPGGETGFDLWQAFAGLEGVPSLVLRGELSDLLSEETVERMLAANPAMEAATVPRVGHAPTLDEPEAEAAIDRLLKRARPRRKAAS